MAIGRYVSSDNRRRRRQGLIVVAGGALHAECEMYRRIPEAIYQALPWRVAYYIDNISHNVSLPIAYLGKQVEAAA